LLVSGAAIKIAQTPSPSPQVGAATPRRHSRLLKESSSERCDFSAYAPVRISFIDPKAIIKRVEPEYPLNSAKKGVHGRVVVKGLVNELGRFEQACRVSGEESLGRA